MVSDPLIWVSVSGLEKKKGTVIRHATGLLMCKLLTACLALEKWQPLFISPFISLCWICLKSFCSDSKSHLKVIVPNLNGLLKCFLEWNTSGVKSTRRIFDTSPSLLWLNRSHTGQSGPVLLIWIISKLPCTHPSVNGRSWGLFHFPFTVPVYHTHIYPTFSNKDQSQGCNYIGVFLSEPTTFFTASTHSTGWKARGGPGVLI